MARITLRLPEDLHEKLRWLAYRDRMSQQSLLLEALAERLKDVHVPEGREGS